MTDWSLIHKDNEFRLETSFTICPCSAIKRERDWLTDWSLIHKNKYFRLEPIFTICLCSPIKKVGGGGGGQRKREINTASLQTQQHWPSPGAMNPGLQQLPLPTERVVTPHVAQQALFQVVAPKDVQLVIPARHHRVAHAACRRWHLLPQTTLVHQQFYVGVGADVYAAVCTRKASLAATHSMYLWECKVTRHHYNAAVAAARVCKCY